MRKAQRNSWMSLKGNFKEAEVYAILTCKTDKNTPLTSTFKVESCLSGTFCTSSFIVLPMVGNVLTQKVLLHFDTKNVFFYQAFAITKEDPLKCSIPT